MGASHDLLKNSPKYDPVTSTGNCYSYVAEYYLGDGANKISSFIASGAQVAGTDYELTLEKWFELKPQGTTLECGDLIVWRDPHWHVAIATGNGDVMSQFGFSRLKLQFILEQNLRLADGLQSLGVKWEKDKKRGLWRGTVNELSLQVISGAALFGPGYRMLRIRDKLRKNLDCGSLKGLPQSE